MCLPGAAAGGLLGGLLQGIGGMVTANEDQKNADRIARARNQRLQAALKRNDEYARVARERFDSRTDGQAADPEGDLNAAKTGTGEAIAANIETPDYEAGAPISGSAPPIVRSALAKKMLDTFQQSTTQAKALGALGGYSNYWFDQGVDTTGAGRDIGIQNDFSRGNMAILPYEQDFAEVQANKPRSGLGGLLSGLGGFFG